MSFKPGDFFLGVVTFLGVLVPGAVLITIQGPAFLELLGQKDQSLTVWLGESTAHWLIFGGVAYIAGQLLLALTEFLNPGADLLAPLWRWLHLAPLWRRLHLAPLWRQLHEDIGVLRSKAAGLLPAEIPGGNGSLFHAAISSVRLGSSEAAAEVDRHMADYKLLRNLVGVVLVDLAVSAVRQPRSVVLTTVELVLGVLSFVAFVRVFYWTQLLAFEYVVLIHKDKPATADLPAPKKAAGKSILLGAAQEAVTTDSLGDASLELLESQVPASLDD